MSRSNLHYPKELRATSPTEPPFVLLTVAAELQQLKANFPRQHAPVAQADGGEVHVVIHSENRRLALRIAVTSLGRRLMAAVLKTKALRLNASSFLPLVRGCTLWMAVAMRRAASPRVRRNAEHLVATPIFQIIHVTYATAVNTPLIPAP